MKNRRTASYYQEDFQAFFSELPGFKENAQAKKMRFIRNFPRKKIRIIVTMPILQPKNGPASVISGLHIEFAVEFNGKTCLEFRDSRVLIGWKKITTRKINTLIDLIKTAPLCPICRSLMYPRKSTDNQVNPKGTSFVWHTCSGEKCHNNVPTPYRTGLKTAISDYLKRD